MSRAEQSPDLTVIVPCYREGPTLPESLARLTGWLQRRGIAWELLLIDDASPDDTRALVDAFVAAHPELPLRTAHHAVNTGRSTSIRCGVTPAARSFAMPSSNTFSHASYVTSRLAPSGAVSRSWVQVEREYHATPTMVVILVAP